MHSTLHERLSALTNSHADRVALIEPQRTVSYAKLALEVSRLASYFASRGIRAGDRVAIWLPNSIEWVSAFLGLSHLGAIALSVNTRFRAHELQDLIDRGRACGLIYWPGFKGIDFDGMLADISATSLASITTTVTMPELRQASQRDWPDVPAHGDHPALTFSTSGTTSEPKFVLHSQSVMVRHADAVARALRYDDTTRVLASAPFCGAFGFATLISGLLTGHAVVLEPVSTPHSLLALVRQHRVTHTYANNALILQMLQASNDRADFASCQLFGFASFAPAQHELFDLARHNGLSLTGLYGSSELMALTAAQPTEPADGDTHVRHEPGGRLLHESARVRARDPETGHLLPVGQSGEIEIITPSHMVGYIDQSQATQAAFTPDGYFKTSDLGWCVSDRQFVFQARMGDALRLGGFLVNPAEIESFIETLPGVAACQVVAVDHQGKRVPVAFVVPAHNGSDAGQTEAESNPQAWQQACKHALAAYKVPAHIEVVKAFPMIQSANSAKVQKSKLRDMARERLGSPHA